MARITFGGAPTTIAQKATPPVDPFVPKKMLEGFEPTFEGRNAGFWKNWAGSNATMISNAVKNLFFQRNYFDQNLMRELSAAPGFQNYTPFQDASGRMRYDLSYGGPSPMASLSTKLYGSFSPNDYYGGSRANQDYGGIVQNSWLQQAQIAADQAYLDRERAAPAVSGQTITDPIPGTTTIDPNGLRPDPYDSGEAGPIIPDAGPVYREVQRDPKTGKVIGFTKVQAQGNNAPLTEDRVKWLADNGYFGTLEELGFNVGGGGGGGGSGNWWGGGGSSWGGGGGYTPYTSGSNWITRLLTNWRINSR